jgi:hypothetical protein
MTFFQKTFWPGALTVFFAAAAHAADGPTATPATAGLHAALSEDKWQQVDGAVDRGLAWIASQQTAGGRFGDYETPDSTQPAVTSLCIMAFLSRGHLPGYGPYGDALNRAVDFVISCQMEDGLFSYLAPLGAQHRPDTPVGNAVYNHAIAGLMLGEVYGHVTGPRMKQVRIALDKALAFTRALQTREKANPEDRGGWRYLRLFYMFDDSPPDSDMSVTAWQLMFLRSARNAEFNVPQVYIDNAMAYVHRSFDPDEGVFYYVLSGGQGGQFTRGLVGAGIVALSLAGEHRSPMALKAGEWLLAHPFRYFDQTFGGGGRMGGNGGDRFYYSTYYCSQAAAQLGGHYWETLFPPLADILVSAQNHDGSWPRSNGGGGGFGGGGGRNEWRIGPVYPTAMAVLSLTPGDQLLPVYQR